MARRFHPFIVDVKNQLVAAHEVVVLPRARVASVSGLAALVTKFAAVARDVNGTLRFGKRSGAVGLFLSVVGRGRATGRIRNVVPEIRIEFVCFGATARIPNCWIAAA